MAYFKTIYTFLWLYQWFNYLPESEVAVAILELFFPTTGGGGVAAAPLPMPTPTHHSTYAYVTKIFLFFQWFWYLTLILAMPKGLIFSPEHVLNIVLIGFSWSSLASFYIAERSSN